MDGSVEAETSVKAGIALAPLIAAPQTWINRRVETIELLSHEETRRKVSIDFTLPSADATDLATPHGVVVPISVLTKEARRNFDLRDESGRAVPVLGREDNGDLTHVALLASVLEAIPDAPDPVVESISSDVRTVVYGEPAVAREALGGIAARAAEGDRHYAGVWGCPTCRAILETVTDNYVLFAVLATSTERRRILKYGYGEYFDLSRGVGRLPTDLGELGDRLRRPDRRAFLIDCPAARRAQSFHVEIAVPEELRIEVAFLVDRQTSELVSAVDLNVDRASLYAAAPAGEREVGAYLETVTERAGVTSRAAGIAVAVSALLWAGVVSGLDASNPAPAVSILLAGAALYSGTQANSGEHRLVRVVYRSPRRWLGVVAIAALIGSMSLALEVPVQRPVDVWLVAAVASLVAAIRLGWSAVRAPS